MGAAAVAARSGVPLVIVETGRGEEAVAARMAARTRAGTSPSDATLATYQRQRAALTQAPTAVPDDAMTIQVDTSGGLPNTLDPMWTSLRAAFVAPVIPSLLPGRVRARTSSEA